jgi:hypothetical protein
MVKHGGGRIVLGDVFQWQGLVWGRVLDCCILRIEGKMNRAKYREIIDENLLQSAQDLILG